MGFPIAMGTGPFQSSSRALPRIGNGSDAVMAVATNTDGTLAATVIINYHFIPASSKNGPSDNDFVFEPLSNESTCRGVCNVVAELRIHIALATAPFVSENFNGLASRETRTRVPLGALARREKLAPYVPKAAAEFSSNDCHLACIIPYPESMYPINDTNAERSASIMTIFRIIQAKRQSRQLDDTLPRLPDFVVVEDRFNTGETNVPVADERRSKNAEDREAYQTADHQTYETRNPRIVRVPPSTNDREVTTHNFLARQLSTGSSSTVDTLDSRPLQSATSMCNFTYDYAKGKSQSESLLLVSTIDGALMFVDFATASVQNETLIDQEEAFSAGLLSTGPIVHVSACHPSSWIALNVYGDEKGSLSQGRVAIVSRDGALHTFTTQFTPVEKEGDNSSCFQFSNGLGLTLKLLAFYRPSNENARFATAEWLNPLHLVVLTRPLCGDECVCDTAAGIPASELTVAQVWDISTTGGRYLRNQHLDWHFPGSTTTVGVSLISELKIPPQDGFVGISHDSFTSGSSCLKCSRSSTDFKCFGSISVKHHRRTGCLSVSSVLAIPSGVRLFCTTWDWKRNCLALTLVDTCVAQLPKCSWFQLCDSSDGLFAVHVYEQSQQGYSRARKDVFKLGVLSPTPRLAEPNALLLAGDSVSFPFLAEPFADADAPLHWMEEKIPSSYVAVNKRCDNAVISRSLGRTVAVAGERGLCILDLSNLHVFTDCRHTPCQESDEKSGAFARSQFPRWKLFRNVNEEQRFKVVDMLFWERGLEFDDLLVALIQYNGDNSSWLVCWSHRRLGFGRGEQLFVDMGFGCEGHSLDGVKLPSGFDAPALAIIEEPNREKAVLAVTSTASGSVSMVYAIYQLQVTRRQIMKEEVVLVRLSCHGEVPLGRGSLIDTDSVASFFLAGASFGFELANGRRHLGSAALLGVITFSHGVIAVHVDGMGVASVHRPFLVSRGFVTSIWKTGSSFQSGRLATDWNVAFSDGQTVLWRVPCHDGNTECLDYDRDDFLGIERHPLMGAFVNTGPSSLWMNGSTSSEREICLGPIQPTSFGCTMYVGQKSKRSSGCSFFHVGSMTIAPPHFAPRVYAALLRTALECRSVDDPRGEGDDTALEAIQSPLIGTRHLGSSSSALRRITLKVVDILNSSKAARNKLDTANLDDDEQRELRLWNMGKTLMTRIVTVAQEVLNELQFASLFLSIGRQLEPHEFALIFPLPAAESPITAEDLFVHSGARGSLRTAASSLPLFSSHGESHGIVVQLLCHCLRKLDEDCKISGVKTSQEEQSFLHQLFWFGVKLEEALEIERSEQQTVGETFGGSSCDESSSSTSDSSSADEDSTVLVNHEDLTAPFESIDEEFSDDEDSEVQERGFLTPCRTQRLERKSRTGILRKVVTSLFVETEKTAPTNDAEEDIADAASSFVLSGFEEAMLAEKTGNDSVAEKTGNDSDEEDSTDGYSREGERILVEGLSRPSVAGAMCMFVCHSIQRKDAYRGWRALSAVARIIVGDRSNDAIKRRCSDRVLDICREMKVVDSNDPVGVCKFLKRLDLSCSEQMHAQCCEDVFNLVLILLMSFDSGDEAMFVPLLVSVGVVTGVATRRIDELIDHTKP